MMQQLLLMQQALTQRLLPMQQVQALMHLHPAMPARTSNTI